MVQRVYHNGDNMLTIAIEFKPNTTCAQVFAAVDAVVGRRALAVRAMESSGRTFAYVDTTDASMVAALRGARSVVSVSA